MGSWMSKAGGVGSAGGGGGMSAGGGGGGGMSGGNMAGLMGGGGGDWKQAMRTAGLASYKDMSKGDVGGLMNMVLGNQQGSQSNMKNNMAMQDRQRQQAMQGGPYMQGLMNRGMGG